MTGSLSPAVPGFFRREKNCTEWFLLTVSLEEVFSFAASQIYTNVEKSKNL
jgi:hypothetical protein